MSLQICRLIIRERINSLEFLQLSVINNKFAFTGTTYRTDIISRQVVEVGSGFNSCRRFSICRFIYVTTDHTFISIHAKRLKQFYFSYHINNCSIYPLYCRNNIVFKPWFLRFATNFFRFVFQIFQAP